MISKQAVDEQLKQIGCNFKFWGRSEVNELGRILMEDEIIAECVNGQYSNGFAMLVATNHRVLLIDKKPLLYLTVEDLRFDMITEFNYNHRLLDATINLFTANKTLTFTSWNQHRLRKLMEYTQAHVLEMRKQQHLATQFQAVAAAHYMQNAQNAQGVQDAQNGQDGQTQTIQNPMLLNQQGTGITPALAPPIQESIQGQIGQGPSIAATPDPAAQQFTYQPEPIDHDNSSRLQRPGLPALARLEHSIASGFATAKRRATLGTYTRSKLPALHLRVNGPASYASAAETGETAETSGTAEVYRRGFSSKPTLKNLGMPFEY